ncbi:hypothetical protein J8Y17_28110 (plasmid) [Bacillus cereus]|uniref:hypothetical protein n=1 Tax=Bacillus cereus TaxID=1396 RepID=UPI001B8BE445|nr:hypothetical protein [Bacillus cereus]QUW34562.1 hypothetical protein J8Y17_28110 [Bacillus cereus]
MKVNTQTVLLAIKDSKGEVYTMPSQTDKCIYEVHYSTSYIQFIVQDIVEEDGKVLYPSKNIFVILENSNPIDLIALKDDEIGELVDVRKEN